MVFQCLSISVILIVLLSAQIDASRSVRQAPVDQCANPNGNACLFVQCEAGECIEDKTTADCFKCRCPPGLTGKLCETVFVILPPGCTPGCQNGGVCNGNVCSCPAGYTGAYCESQEQVASCNPGPCGAHGTCIQANLPTGPAIFCNCADQWTGKYCDTNLPATCASGYCLSGGLCQMNGNTPYCICPPMYTGQRCEIATGTTTTTTTGTTTTTTTTGTGTTTATTTTGTTPTPGNCSSRPCLNGGSCFNTGNSFVCLCAPQWSGSICHIPQNPTPSTTTNPTINIGCSPNPCYNGGSCYKHGNSYVCVCTSQFTGATCASIKTPTGTSTTTPSTGITCANQPCRNGGVCYNNGNSYFCYCANSNYTGTNCETSITVTPSNCPLNCTPGQCVSTGNTQVPYACMCNGMLNPTSCNTI